MNIRTIRESKGEHKLVMLTAFDAITAAMAVAGGVDIILVGDSLGNTSLGLGDTLPVSFETMVERTAAVRRVSGDIPVVLDMPFLSYGVTEEESVRLCGRALKESGCHAVKMEGGAWLAPIVEHLVRLGIPVMGHVGLQPQHVHQYGGMLVQGRDSDAAEAILNDARALCEAGAFSLVAECVPAPLGKRITDSVSVPVFGIGAGPDTDGQVQVISDLLGMKDGKVPRHARAYADLFRTAADAIDKYAGDVREGRFPDEDSSFL